MSAVKRVFTVNGKPFYPVCGQSYNDGGYNDSESEICFKAVKLFNGNTAVVPVCWCQIETEESKFDFNCVDALLASARRYGVKLILLWFATWKNGNMDYTPGWVKTNPQRFKRALSPIGADLWVLSSYCQANLDADKKAFSALCKHLKAKDSTEQTVIGIQVENEPAVNGTDRDYCPEAQAVFDGPVPDKLIASMKAAGKCPAWDIWQRAGGRQSGTWLEVFDWPARDIVTAWSIATYIDAVAEAGKAVYNLPMYINVAVGVSGWHGPVPDEIFTSGNPLPKVLDVYKWFTPHLDMIAPDVEYNDSQAYDALCALYSRDDNPLFFPETPPTTHLFSAIANYNLIGYSWMGGLENVVGPDGSVNPLMQEPVDTVKCIVSAIPLLLKYQGTGKIHAIIQEEYMPSQWLNLDGYIGRVQFGVGRVPFVNKDWRHKKGEGMPKEQADTDVKPEYKRGRGLLIQASKDEFYLVGTGWRLFLRPKYAPAKNRPLLTFHDDFTFTPGRHLTIEEGHFDQNGEFAAVRQRNKDPMSQGAWVEADIGVLRIRMCN
jgi:hypothetical protein